MQQEPTKYDLCGRMIGAAMRVHSALGPGFLESVYRNALVWDLRKVGIKAEAERPISVHYDGQLVDAFTADLLVNDSFIVELKSIQVLAQAHEVQLVSSLVATAIDEGLLLNFGAQSLEFKKKFRVPKSEPVSL